MRGSRQGGKATVTHRMLNWLAGFAVAVTTVVVPAAPAPAAVPPGTAAPPAAAAPSLVTAAAPVTHRTVFATQAGTLFRLTLDATGAVIARTPVSGGTGSVAADYDGSRLLSVRDVAAPGEDEIALRTSQGASTTVANGRSAVFTPGRTGMAVARYVTVGRNPDSMDPEHDELSVHNLGTGRITALGPHRDGVIDLGMRYARDGRSLWLLTAFLGESDNALMRYDLATRTITRSYTVYGGYGCRDVEMLPSGANAVIACGARLLTIRLATGTITHRTALPAGRTVTALGGRLNDHTLLLSMSEGARRWLAALDLDTMRMRALPGSYGHHAGVTDY